MIELINWAVKSQAFYLIHFGGKQECVYFTLRFAGEDGFSFFIFIWLVFNSTIQLKRGVLILEGRKHGRCVQFWARGKTRMNAECPVEGTRMMRVWSISCDERLQDLGMFSLEETEKGAH